MLVHILKSKIHRAQVTAGNVDYEGSLGIARDLMDKVGLLPYERILCGNMANGERFETYAIPAEPRLGPDYPQRRHRPARQTGRPAHHYELH